MAAVTDAVILEPPKIKSVTISTFSPSIYHEMMGLDGMILVFWMLSFKSAFSFSSFTLIRSLFSSLLSAIRGVSSAYLRFLIFLPSILIPSSWSTLFYFLPFPPNLTQIQKIVNSCSFQLAVIWYITLKFLYLLSFFKTLEKIW